MKPIRLSLSAFGAFADHVEIDFEALAPRGLFLVSGETGAGKTTIFDAMCWAIYGKMPLKDVHGVRSHHVDDATRCEVSFTFDSGGERYTVTRNPQQLRPGKRSGGHPVKEAAAATLVRHVGDGTELISNRVSEIKDTCEAIIGLDDVQVQRVILLPQGDFDKFLLANSTDREKILERLFGGAIYDRIVEQLKATRDARQSALGEADIQVQDTLEEARRHLEGATRTLDGDDPDESDDSENSHASDGQHDLDDPDSEGPDAPIDPERLTATLSRCMEQAAIRQQEAEAAAIAARRAGDAHRAGEDQAKRFDRADTLKTAMAGLADAAEAITQAKRAAEASRAARPVVEADDSRGLAVAAQEKAEGARDVRVQNVSTILDSLAAPADSLTPAALQRQLAELRETHRVQSDQLEAHRKAHDALVELRKNRLGVHDEITTLETEIATGAGRLTDIDAAMPDLHAKATDPEQLRGLIEQAERAAEDRTELAETEKQLLPATAAVTDATAEYERRLQRFVDTQAPRLAATLEEGDPCPVCGSTDHPVPASSDDAEPISWAEVDDAAQSQRSAQETLSGLQTSATTLRGRLGDDADVAVDRLTQRVDKLLTDLEAAIRAGEDVGRLEAERTELDATLHKLDQNVAAKSERRRLLDGDIVEAERVERTTAEAAKGIEADVLSRRARALDSLEETLEDFDSLVNAASAAATTTENRRADVLTRLEHSPHDDVATARDALMSVEAETRAITAADEHASKTAEIRVELGTLVTAGIPEVRPDLDATKEALDIAVTESTARQSQVTELGVHLSNARQALDEHKRLVGESETLRAQAQVAERAYVVCHKGGSATQVPLKRWVLAHELDRITTCANGHLHSMTNGRYTLERSEGFDGRHAAGLELAVHDANTGRSRSTTSLSGGEQFQASLALALGLADVISHGGTAGGQHFEALFVDEGFGSLSTDALQDAVDTLVRLQDTGRMVGAITHVESMKEALHVGIAVARRDDGRGSTLTVNY